jgi:hypothetical protein
MDYEGNPLDPTGGGSVPTDLTALENKTQNIDVTTSAGSTNMNGLLTLSKIDTIDTNIIDIGTLGAGVIQHVMKPNLCLGQTFILHTADGKGVDVEYLLIPASGWDGVFGLGKRCAIFKTLTPTTALYMTGVFRKSDCMITADFFYRYPLPDLWHLDDGNYIMTCMADSNDGYFMRPVSYTYDPIIIPVDINYSLFVNDTPTLEGLVSLYGPRLDILYHCSFQYKKALPDSSKLTVGDVAVANTTSLVAALAQLYARQPQYGYVDITSSLTEDQYINPFYQPISTSWGPAYSSGFTTPLDQTITHLTTSPHFVIPSDGSYIDYILPSSPYPGSYKFDIDSSLTFASQSNCTFGFCLDISLLDSTGVILPDFDKQFHMVTFRASTGYLTWSYADVISVLVTNPLTRKIRLQIQSITSNATVVSLQTPLSYKLFLKHRVKYIN